MKAVVLLRAAVDREAGPSAAIQPLLNDPLSLTALALALTWKRAAPGSAVQAIAAGPAEWEPLLREAVALGADAALRVEPPADGVVATVDALAAAIAADADIVLAGAASSDHGTGALPAALAEALGWPLVAEVVRLEARDGETHVTVRASASLRSRLRLRPPAVVVAAAASPPLLYPPLVRRLAAQRAAIETLSPAASPGAGGIEVLGYGPPRPRTRHLFRPDDTARPGEKLRQLMGGGRAPPAVARVETSAGDLAGRLLDVLAREGLLPPAAPSGQ